MNQEGLRKFVDLMSERVIGQQIALRRINDALASASGLQQSTRPLATLLFAGAIGLGKRTTARKMAGILFGSDTAFTEISTGDRTEEEIIKGLSTKPSIALLRNASDTTNERELAEVTSVLKKFKNGHPFTAPDGKPIELRNSVFIASINTELPVELTLTESDESNDSLRVWLQRRFKGTFADEFFESFDAIVPFKRFNVADKVRLAEMKISEIAAQQSASGRTLTADNSVAAYVGSRARDELGGLDVQRAFDQYVRTPLNEAVIEYQASGNRATRVRMSVVDTEIRISVE